MERKGLESGVGDVIQSIYKSGRAAGEKRVPKYNIKGELVGYKTHGDYDYSTYDKDEQKKDKTIIQSGIGQYQAPEYVGVGSRKYLRAAAKMEGIDHKQSNKKLRIALMALEKEGETKKDVYDVKRKIEYVKTDNPGYDVKK